MTWKNSVASTATPREAPSCSTELSSPVADPTSWSSISPITMLNSGTKIIPMPSPNVASPGARSSAPTPPAPSAPRNEAHSTRQPAAMIVRPT